MSNDWQVTLEYGRWRGHVTVSPAQQEAFVRWLHVDDIVCWEHEGVTYYRTGLERVTVQKPPDCGACAAWGGGRIRAACAQLRPKE